MSDSDHSSLASLSFSEFEVREEIYTSTLSRVYRATRQTDGAPVILKILNKDYPSPRQIARYRREYEITRGLDSTGTIAAYQLQPYENTLLMELEDFGGNSLDLLMVSRVFAVDEFLRLALRITEILSEIHQAGVIHKDIGPPNIVWNPQTDRIKIIDFGISAELARETPRLLPPEHLEGSLRYISPEQTGRMNRSVDNRSDLYSLGATFFHMLAGRPPFEGMDPLDLVHAHIARLPDSLVDLNPAVPESLAAIVARLLAKKAEDRYQSAYGLKADLERCLREREEGGVVSSFPPGQHDVPDRFYLPQKLYGREAEAARLQAAFQEVTRGRCELFLIAGYAGIGKTVLVGELHPVVAESGGYFVSGKFDQFKRSIPYMALLQAIRNLVETILTESPEQIKVWKERFQNALGRNGAVVTEVIPEVTLVVGEQAPVSKLGPSETQNRFESVFGDFLRALAGPERPLVVFLDDLHWADAASLRLIEGVVLDPETRGLLIIGAYRDNEVDESHPLAEVLARLEKRGRTPNRIALSPLAPEEINLLTADTVHAGPESALPLSGLIFEKTHGNPFFASEFLRSLYREEMLVFDGEAGGWRWDLSRIAGLGITENVADLMARNIGKLSPEGLYILQLAACIGASFSLGVLAIVREKTARETAGELAEVLRSGLILPIGDEYKYVESGPDGMADVEYRFLHDRVQQAAYQSIGEERREEVHLTVGRFLRDRLPPDKLDENIFTIVGHMNKGAVLITDPDERRGLAELNLTAGKRARLSVAYAPAADFLARGMELLPPGIQGQTAALSVKLRLERAETYFLLGDYEEADELASTVVDGTDRLLEISRAYEIKIRSLHARGQLADSIRVAAKILRLLGVNFPAEPPSFLRVLLELVRVQWSAWRIGEDRFVAKSMSDPRALAAMRILANIGSNAYQLDSNLFALVSIHMTRLSYRYGIAPESPYGVALLGTTLAGIQRFRQADRYRKISDRLLKLAEDRAMTVRPSMVIGTFLYHWHHPVRESLPYLDRGAEAGRETGDLEFRGYCYLFRSLNGFTAGMTLPHLDDRLTRNLNAIVGHGHRPVEIILRVCSQFFYNLRNAGTASYELDGERFPKQASVAEMERMGYATGLGLFHYLQGVLYFLFNKIDLAREELYRGHTVEPTLAGLRALPYLYLFRALTLLDLARRAATTGERRVHLRTVRRILRRIKRWASLNAENNEAMSLLTQAELEGVIGEPETAMILYDRAVEAARASEHSLEIALAQQLAGQFYLRKGRAQIAHIYLANAHYAYERWGADAVAGYLEQTYPRIRLVSRTQAAARPLDTSNSETTTADMAWTLDLHAVIKAAQSISGDLEWYQLLKRLMHIVLANAGAQRGLLLLEENGVWEIAAEGGRHGTVVVQSRPADEGQGFASGVFHYVLHTGQPVMLDDAARDPRFSNDDYIQKGSIASLFCLPLLNRNRLAAMLYLENNLTAGAFTEDRTEILRLLSSQIAVAIENARLYTGLQEEIKRRNQLEKTRKTQSEIIAKLNHELQIPVLGVLANIESMERALERDRVGQLREKMQRAKHYLLYLKTLIHNMTFASASEFRDPFYVTPENSADLVECYAGAANLVSDIHDGELEARLEPPNVRIACQEALLMIVLVNVLGNCAEHSRRVELEWREEPGFCVLSCENELISPIDVNAIFDKWTSTRRDGTKPILGLGLNIARSILEQIGGRISAQQESGRFALIVYFPVQTGES